MAEKLIKCAWCGAYFKEKERPHGSHQKYCSVKCRGKANYAQKAEALKKNKPKKELGQRKSLTGQKFRPSLGTITTPIVARLLNT